MKLLGVQKLGFIVGIAWLAAGCGDTSPTGEQPAADELEAPRSGPAITIGDIDPAEPAKRVRRLQPLADLLASRLAEHGIVRGRVVVARSIDEMGEMLRNGEVDLLFDSPLPVLEVRRACDGEIVLRRAAGGDFEYWSVFITQTDSDITGLEDLQGRNLALQERHSTTGFLLPMIALQGAGLEVQAVQGPSSVGADDRVGVFFSQDEENSVEMIRADLVDAAVISNQEFDDLPPEYRREMIGFARTAAAPRQLVLARGDLGPELKSSVERILLGLTDEDRAEMAARDPELGWTWLFGPVDSVTLDVLSELEAALSIEGPM